jgi:Beta-galactosidase
MLICLLRIEMWSRIRQLLAAPVLLSMYFLSFLGPRSLSAAESAGIPRGVFSLAGVDEPADSSVLTNPLVVGISIRQAWRVLEKSPGVYNWSFLDSEVSRAAQAGKVVLLRVLSEGPSTPEWALDGVQTFHYEDRNRYHAGRSGLIAVYWDKTYLARKKAMIQALGAHFSSNPAVRVVAAICASSHSGDWAVPHSRFDIANWYAIGYSPERMIDVCKQIIDVTMESFPRQCVTLAVGRDGRLDPDPNYVARAAVQYGRSHYSGRFIAQKNSLAATTPAPGASNLKHFEMLEESGSDVAGQMLWYSYGDPTCRNNGGRAPCDPESTLRRAVDIGLAYHMKYIEIYQQDVLHLPGVIRYAHDALAK